jgi:membrane associated rhomboid family serine protease
MTNDNFKPEPIFNLPPVVQALCLINIGVFALGLFFPRLMTDNLLYALSFVPARYTGMEPMGYAGIISPITYMFIHAGWLHISMNLLTLMAFGAGLEKALGTRKMLLFYFATGLCGALLHALVYPHSDAPVIGASGAISGLFGGIMLLMNDTGMMGGLNPVKGFAGYKKLLPVIILWIGVSIFFGFFGMPGVDNPIAWTVHVGGFISGLLLYRPLRRLKI